MIGRVLERKSLMRAVESDESQFVAVYGRRRIGKTYLVRETLGKLFCFEHSGIFGETLAGELSAFRDLVAHGKTVYLTMVTSAGLARNAYTNSVQSEVTLDDLFRA